jgi:hypothetical protein
MLIYCKSEIDPNFDRLDLRGQRAFNHLIMVSRENECPIEPGCCIIDRARFVLLCEVVTPMPTLLPSNTKSLEASGQPPPANRAT